MSDLVTLRHPKLPADQVIRIHRRRIGARLAAGWVEVTPESKPAPKPERPLAQSAVEEPKPTETKRQRRKNEEQ